MRRTFFAACFAYLAVVPPLWADARKDALVRIETITIDQATDALIQYFSSLSVDCQIVMRSGQEDALLSGFLGAMLTDLQVPQDLQPELADILEQRLDNLDDPDNMTDAKLDAAFEGVSMDSDGIVLRERDCEISGS